MNYSIGTRCNLERAGCHCATIVDFAKANGLIVHRLERAGTQSVYATLSKGEKVIGMRLADHSPYYGGRWITAIKAGELKFNTRGTITLVSALTRVVAIS
jgi:hypothetical protein